MYDRCRHWRDRLSRYVDGTLPEAEAGLLHAHLSRCQKCRQAYEADRAMQAYFRTPLHVDVVPGPSFDDRVVGALGAGTDTTRLQGSRVPGSHREVPFFLQVAGGGLIAASITLACLLTALYPQRSDPAVAGRVARLQAARNLPPVPLESLLSTPAPRAALLWSPTPPSERPAVGISSGRRSAR
ncbi:MAG: zf-HC2 domain-containing protein [Chloroherpetonaceae bacterium]|nr:zf-HC2 domain-containing protein [Chthonomonadaceae bacterium]MDW8208823.1 zf-HC2 domain-containing protein [Chloroherpetonaceae bacterium]